MSGNKLKEFEVLLMEDSRHLNIVYYPEEVTKKEIYNCLVPIGTITDFQSLPANNPTLRERLVFVTFEKEIDAERAFVMLQNILTTKKKEKSRKMKKLKFFK